MASKLFDNFPGDPTDYVFWEEFDVTSGADSAATWLVKGWTLSQLGSAGTAATLDTDAEFGQALLSTTAADNKGPELQLLSESVALRAGKTTRFLARIKHSVVLTDTFFIGLALTDTSISHATDGTLANVTTATDCVGFVSAEADASLYGIVRRDSTQAATGAMATLADATWVDVAFEVKMDPTTAGTGTVRFWVNGAPTGTLTSTTLPHGAEEMLTPSIALAARSATGSTMHVDFVGVSQTR